VTQKEFENLKVGDEIYDTYLNRWARIDNVYPPTEYNPEWSVQFSFVETRTVYAHGANTLKVLVTI
jgi:hypothetical protein